MSFTGRFERLFRTLLPSPFALAVALTFTVIFTAIVGFIPDGQGLAEHTVGTIQSWYQGIWSAPMLVFGYQMMLILVLGHVLALSAPAEKIIHLITSWSVGTSRAAAMVCLVCVALGLLNWGLALIFGAILARKIAEHSSANGHNLNYPLIAACGYTGMMVWHGGLSGSALIKAAEPGHLHTLMAGSPLVTNNQIPAELGLGSTLLSPMNLSVSGALLLVLPVVAYLIGKKNEGAVPQVARIDLSPALPEAGGMAEKTDTHFLPVLFIGSLCIVAAILVAYSASASGNPNIVGPDFINLCLLGLGLLAHGNLHRFGSALEAAIVGASSILIQFPLYFGIMAVLKSSGMGASISAFFVHISSPTTYQLLTFFSAGFVNILVPSGGGQWMIQGPIIIEASQKMGLSLSQSILAMAYGDQITNMMQPFWALPLLSITGLQAREVLPYTLCFMAAGTCIFVIALWVF
jgi:short-chain fatty acids transporter